MLLLGDKLEVAMEGRVAQEDEAMREGDLFIWISSFRKGEIVSKCEKKKRLHF